MDAASATRMPVTGTWLRHIPAGSDPLYRPPTPADGRWQRGATIEGIYLAAEEATVWAEWYRWLAELEIEPLRGLPRELWRYRASLSSVADLTSADTLAALGLPTAAPSRDQWPLFQDVGEQLHAAGCDGLLYHSAAHPGGLCLCVFRANAAAASGRLEPLARVRRVNRPPTPPRGLRTWILSPSLTRAKPLSAWPRSARPHRFDVLLRGYLLASISRCVAHSERSLSASSRSASWERP